MTAQWRDLSNPGAKPTLSIDFDKPINPYSRGWDGGKVSDLHPQTGARDSLERLSHAYRLVVTTARTDEGPVREALERWGIDGYFDDVSNVKPPAVAYIDDRAIRWATWEQAIYDLERVTGEKI